MRTKLTLVLFVCILAGCAGKRYSRPYPPTPKYVNLIDAQDPACPDMRINPNHVFFESGKTYGAQSSVCYTVENKSPNLPVDIRLLSDSNPDSIKTWKYGPRVGTHGNRTVVTGMCVGKILYICESRNGPQYVNVSLKADALIGNVSYSAHSQRVTLGTWGGYYGGYQRNQSRSWIIDIQQDPLPPPPVFYRDPSGRTYADKNGVIRVR